ncbi:putative eukaryotic translation initiation factor 3 (eIF-3) interacting protein [Trypanosoma cruzi]|uniref:Eukaryotic translation initiation factor 3 subunit L n=2 Tax=Trypanosoma cruzi TaxID=5693 RepID=V5BV76_TRYCR|nr:eukaryotic translation initiation factor 3 subunit L [Trypanosoma cruzi Dm28c]KAF8289038.1 eukaryotic translation initiation factor 3 subunit l [Trypanosoma cruzi]PBJ71897.1 eukaryotic translation initiation factor 3 subunit [Trypanosoma cruzi cruzi]PWU98166.1 eukaryotic translation initiation factor 3 subunit l [Trypanosoma cruzi]RNF22279.1 putative eukaryotic translation initiation factor 3 (eIF-3) interacting protein [Trypanosoma cruzi]
MTTNPDIESDIPHEVYSFFRALNKAVDSWDTSLLHELYENQFPGLTQNFYMAGPGQFRPWPSLRIKAVADCFKNRTAEQLYSFLRLKHLFTDRAVSPNDARSSWDTFNNLFNALPSGSCDVPNWLLWDIFDEFLFQMTVVYQKRFTGRVGWSVNEGMQLMERVVAESGIEEAIQSENLDEITKPGARHAQWMCGFFGIVTIAKVNVLLGDYMGALSALKPLDVYGRGRQILLVVAPAYVSLLYHMGFSYLMLRRYADASRVFRLSLTTKVSSRKFSEKMQFDCAYMHVISCILGGMQPDNLSWLVEPRKLSGFEDEKELLSAGDEERFREVFDRCSPKFLAIPPITTIMYKGTDGKELQARLFRRAVKQQEDIIKLRGFFGVYQTTTTELVKTVLDVDDGHVPLFAMRLRSRQLVHDGSSADLLSGSYAVRSAIDYTVKGENIDVVQKSSYRTTESKYFMRINNLRRRQRHFENQRQERRQVQPISVAK